MDGHPIDWVRLHPLSNTVMAFAGGEVSLFWHADACMWQQLANTAARAREGGDAGSPVVVRAVFRFRSVVQDILAHILPARQNSPSAGRCITASQSRLDLARNSSYQKRSKASIYERVRH
jgi:hypothetical protein